MTTLYKILSIKHRLMVLAIVLLTVAGCAGVTATKPDAAGPKVPVTTTSRTDHDKSSLWEPKARKFLAEASAFEAKGDLYNALEYVKIALTIDPSNPTARGELNRLILKRNNEAAKYFNAGNAVRSSNPKEAARLFFAALRTRHDYPESLASLRELHLLKEEAALLARIKKEALKGLSDYEDIDVANYSLEVATLSYEEGEYMTAIREFEKIKTRYPNDQDIQLYLNSSYYNVGMSWLSKKDSRKALSWFTKVDKGFERVDDYIKKCRENLRGSTNELFKAGLKLYQENKFTDAVTEWKSVLEIDPEHKQAKEYMKKANKKIQDSRKKSR